MEIGVSMDLGIFSQMPYMLERKVFFLGVGI